MKQVVIGIHGLGNKPPKYLLKKWWKDAIKEGLNKNEIPDIFPKFEMVYWADIIYEKPLSKWEKNKKSPYYLDERYTKAPENYAQEEDTDFYQKVIDFVSNQLNNVFLNPDKTLNYSFITDFIVQNFFKDLDIYYSEDCKIGRNKNKKAKHLIRNRLIQVLDKYKDYQIMIVAHSMGSIIAYDVLTYLLPKAKIHTLVTIGSPLGLPIVISKIAAEYNKREQKNNFMATPPSVDSNWFNLADIRDKVSVNYKLHDDYNANYKGVTPTDFNVINNFPKNPHKSFGYLRSPEMTGIFKDFINKRRKKITHQILDQLENVVDGIKEKAAFVKDQLKIN